MKVVYGGPKNILTIGVVENDGMPMPFFAFVDAKAVENDAFVNLNAQQAIDEIDRIGGVVVFIENPDAASRLSMVLCQLFDQAEGTDWSDAEQEHGVMQ